MHEFFVEGKIYEEMENNVIKALDASSDNSKKAIKECESELLRATEPVKACRNQMAKEKANCNKLLERVTKNTIKHKIQKKLGQDYFKEIVVECSRYENDIDIANQILSTYSTSQLPQTLSKMQKCEQTRLSTIKTSLEAYSDILNKKATEFQRSAAVLKSIAAQLNPENDLAEFARLSKARPKIPQSDRISELSYDINLEPFTYDLNLSCREVKSRIKEQDPGVFKQTLSKIMDEQRTGSALFSSLKIPRACEAIIQGIKALGGVGTEGIFRVSADEYEVSELMLDLENSNYALKVSSVHVLSNALKRWLRDLEEPLIPFYMYDACIQFVQSKSPADLNEVLGSLLPSDNRHLLEAIILLFRCICSNENLPITKMEKRSLAICIAPSIMKAPVDHKADMLSHVQLMISFITILIERLEIKFYKPFEDPSAIASYELSNRKKKDVLTQNLFPFDNNHEEKSELTRAKSSSDLGAPKNKLSSLKFALQ
jgi:hypothetical protein